MGAIIREQGSSFISYWTLLISKALIKHGADICHDWEAYEESFVKAQRSSAMSLPVHLSSLPLTGCLDVSFVSSFSLTHHGRKWTSEASRDTSVKHSLFLIKQPCYQPSQSDHDVLIRLTEADWYWLSEQIYIFLVAASSAPLPLVHLYQRAPFFCACVSPQFFLIKHSTHSGEKCCLDGCLLSTSNLECPLSQSACIQGHKPKRLLKADTLVGTYILYAY